MVGWRLADQVQLIVVVAELGYHCSSPDFKTPLLWLGIIMNAGGVVYLLWQVRSQRRLTCHTPATG